MIIKIKYKKQYCSLSSAIHLNIGLLSLQFFLELNDHRLKFLLFMLGPFLGYLHQMIENPRFVFSHGGPLRLNVEARSLLMDKGRREFLYEWFIKKEKNCFFSFYKLWSLSCIYVRGHYYKNLISSSIM